LYLREYGGGLRRHPVANEWPWRFAQRHVRGGIGVGDGVLIDFLRRSYMPLIAYS